MVEGRQFTLADLKKAVIAACGNQLNSFYLDCWDLEIWEIIEAVEFVTDSQKPDTDDWEALKPTA